MSEFQIRTAQNIGIKQNLAGIGQRVGAVFIDMIFLSIFYYFVFYLLSLTKFDKHLSAWTFISVIMLPYFLYYPLMQYWNNGQSLGKQLVKIRIVKIDNSHPRLGDFLVRWIFRLFEVNMIPGLGLIVMLFNDKSQRLGDIVAKTVVVAETQKTKLGHSVFEELEQTYTPVFSQAVNLSDKDAQLIKTVALEARKTKKYKVLKELTHKIEILLDVEKPNEMSNKAFIDTILKDYNYFAGK